MSVEVILEKVKEEEPELVRRCEEQSIDVRKVIEERLERLKRKYSEKTLVSLARAALLRELKKASAVTAKGLLVGCYDVTGFRFPIRFILARKSEEHIAFSNFGTHVGEKEITVPSVAEVHLERDDRGRYRLVDGQFKPVKKEKLVEKLIEVAIPAWELDKHYDEQDEGRAVVVVGRIDRVVPRTRFEDREPVGQWPVLTKDEREDEENYYPTMEIVMKMDGGIVRCRIILEKQRYGRPIYHVEDLEELCKEALESNDPLEQAQFLSDALSGRWVVVAGVLQRYQRSRTGSGEDIDFVDISAGGIYEIESYEKVEEEEAVTEPEEPKPEWEPISAKELDKLASEAKDLPPATKVEKVEVDGGIGFTAEFMDGVRAGIKFDGESIFTQCSCSVDDCKHVLSLWRVFARSEYEKMQPLPAKQEKEKMFHEEKREEVPESEFAKILNLARAYCRAVGLDPKQMHEDIIIEKIGIQCPRAIARAVVQRLREES